MPSVLKGRAVVTANVVTTPAVVTLRIPAASVRNSVPWPLPVSAAVNPKQAPAPVPSCGVVQPALPASGGHGAGGQIHPPDQVAAVADVESAMVDDQALGEGEAGGPAGAVGVARLRGRTGYGGHTSGRQLQLTNGGTILHEERSLPVGSHPLERREPCLGAHAVGISGTAYGAGQDLQRAHGRRGVGRRGVGRRGVGETITASPPPLSARAVSPFTASRVPSTSDATSPPPLSAEPSTGESAAASGTARSAPAASLPSTPAAASFDGPSWLLPPQPDRTIGIWSNATTAAA